MTRFIIAILLLALGASCSRPSESPTGVATWDEANSLAEAFVFHGDSGAYLSHSDFTGVPPKTVQNLKATLNGWHGVPTNLTFAEKRVMNFTEFEAYQLKTSDYIPPRIRKEVLAAYKWNVTPDKVIVFAFTNRADSTAKFELDSGVFETKGLWYFAVNYSK